MKGLILKLAMCVSALPCIADSAQSYTATVDGITWTYIVYNGKASIGTLYNQQAISLSTTGAVSIPSTLGGYPVKSINVNSFKYCSKLTSVTIPNGVESIGNNAFYGCSKLTSVTISESVRSIANSAFNGCGCLKAFNVAAGNKEYKDVNGLLLSKNGRSLVCGVNGDVTIPASVTTIQSEAFSGFVNLTSVTVPSSVTSIGDSVFNGCSSLTNMVLPFVGSSRGNTGTKGSVFGYIFGEESYTGGTKVTQCYDGPVNSPSVDYYIPSSLRSVRITDETVLGYGSFYGCSMLTGIDINSSVSRIGGYSFRNCTGISNLTLPAKIMEIESGTFRGASKLNELSIPNCVTNIGDFALCDCSGLTNVAMPNSLCTIKSSAFSGCSKLTNVTVPSSVTSIGDSAFSGCSGLTSITIPVGVTSIGEYAFLLCKGLKDVTIPPSVKSIAACAFKSCDKIENVYISDITAWCGISFILSGLGYVTNDSEYANPLRYARNLYINGILTRDLSIPDGVTHIGDCAFYGFSGLRSVTLPSTLEQIGYGAFAYCDCLEHVFFRGNAPAVKSQAFDNCNSNCIIQVFSSSTGWGVSDGGVWKGYTLHSSTVIDGVEWVIVDGVLLGVKPNGATVLQVPGNVYRIGKLAFCCDCENVTRIIMLDNVVIIDDNAFRGCSSLSNVMIPNSVTNIGANAFSGCTALTNVTIGSGVRRIGEEAFSGCNGLNSVRIADLAAWCGVLFASENSNPLTFAHNLYLNDELITDLRIPDGVAGIGNRAFQGCYSVTTVTIGSGVRRIGADAFQGCNGLSAVRISDLSAWCGIAFGNSDANPLAYAHKLYLNGELVSDLVIPDDVTVVCDYAFYGCDEFSSVTIHDDVLRVDSYALAGCGGLEEIVVPDSVTNIGSGCFAGCTNLVSMTLPFVGSRRGNSDLDGRFGFIFGVTASDGLTEVGSRYIPSSLRKVVITDETVVSRSAFDQCAMLTDIELNEGIRDIGQWAFAWCNLTNMIIPNSVTNVGMGVFACCGKLESLTLPFVGSRRGNSGTDDSLFGYIFGKNNYEGGTATKQYYSSSSYSTFYIPSSLRSVTITGESELGYGAFYGCNKLTGVTISNSVVSIGSCAFSGCAGLTNVTLSSGVMGIGDHAFQGCGITDIVIPNGVKYIGDDAFLLCHSLTNAVIPNSVTNIGKWAFSYCNNLECLTLPFVGSERGNSETSESVMGHIFGETAYEGLTNVVQTYKGSLTISRYVPLSLKKIIITDETIVAKGAFDNCFMFDSIVLNEGVTQIGEYVFAHCASLKELVIPDGVVSVGEYAFYGCSGLASMAIPDSVTYIGKHAFEGCDVASFDGNGFIIINGWVLGYSNPEVTSLVIPEGVIGIGGSAFADFWNLEEVVFPDSLRYIGGGAFDTCTGLDGVVIPDGVETVGNGAFKNCTYMRNITIGEGVTSIGDEAFAGCTQLSSLSIPDNVTEIGDAAFSNCWRMLSVRLPLGLESVGVNMFSGCTSLAGVTAPTHAFTMKLIFGDRYSSIASVSVSAGETEVCDGAFAGCSALASVAMPNAITNIGNSAFASCPHLAGLELPESLDVIGAGAFSNCTALAAIVLPDGVTAIGQRAFYGCTSLANVTLSRSLASIPDYAFHGCSKLNSMVVPASVGSLGAYIGNYFSSLYYLGNAPSYDANVYASRSRTVTTYVVQGSRGWDGIPSSRDLPTSWNGYGITFWEPNRFDATFDANGGTFFDGSTAYACEQITDTGYALPPYEPTLEGFVFDGWWSDPYEGAQIKASVRVNETRDITFYAHWVGKPSSITVSSILTAAP